MSRREDSARKIMSRRRVRGMSSHERADPTGASSSRGAAVVTTSWGASQSILIMTLGPRASSDIRSCWYEIKVRSHTQPADAA